MDKDAERVEMLESDDLVWLGRALVGTGPDQRERMLALRGALATEAAARAQADAAAATREAAEASRAAAIASADTAKWTKRMTIATFLVVLATTASLFVK